MPNTLDSSKLNLDDFAPKPRSSDVRADREPEKGQGRARPAPVPDRKAWPSREVRDGQLGLRGPVEVLDEFKDLCKLERRSYVDMLRVLMENYSSPEK